MFLFGRNKDSKEEKREEQKEEKNPYSFFRKYIETPQRLTSLVKDNH